MTAAPIDSTAPPSNAAGPAVVTVGSVGDGDDLLTIFSAAISQGDPAVQSVNTLSPATVAAVGGVLRFQHHRSCGAASRPRRLPRGIVCDGDADPPRAKLRDYRAFARLDDAPAGGFTETAQTAPLAET